MWSIVERLIRCGIPEKTAMCVCLSLSDNPDALERFVAECEKHHGGSGDVEAV